MDKPESNTHTEDTTRTTGVVDTSEDSEHDQLNRGETLSIQLIERGEFSADAIPRTNRVSLGFHDDLLGGRFLLPPDRAERLGQQLQTAAEMARNK